MKIKKFVCDGSKPDNEFIQDAVDWGAEEPDEPRVALVTKPSSGETADKVEK